MPIQPTKYPHNLQMKELPPILLVGEFGRIFGRIFGGYKLPCSSTGRRLLTVPISVPSPTARGPRGRSDRDSGGGQKKAKKKEPQAKNSGADGGETPRSEAESSDHTREQVAVSGGESAADNVKERPLEEEGRMRRGVRRVLSSVSGMEFSAFFTQFEMVPSSSESGAAELPFS